ncbi:MAG: hypothetical protein WBJ00_02995 [Dethiobacteria bacterium]|jgi:hypothetical protein
MMETSLSKYILAIITREAGLVSGGGAPVFMARDKEEQEKIALYLTRITGGVIHDLENGVYILVKH